MPGFDGTGPIGSGPMTGKGAGYCGGYPMPDYMNPRFWGNRTYGFGRGFGRGRGFGHGGGRGFRHWYYAIGLPGWARMNMGAPAWGGPMYGFPYAPEMTPQQEADMLKEQVKAMQEEINAINEQISILEKATVEEKK